jgi:hypothetical protein
MTSSHVFQDCPLREALRKDTWPNGVNLQDQLHLDRGEDSGVNPTSRIACLEKCEREEEEDRRLLVGPILHVIERVTL